MTEWNIPTVAHIAADPRAVLTRFRRKPLSFSFGDQRPEAVLLTTDQFDELDGSELFRLDDTILTPEELAEQLPTMIEQIRNGTFTPVVFGDGDDRAMVMSTTQYRDLRGDDHPPEGVDDDPTKRFYNTEPLPTSKPMDLDEFVASLGPEAVKSLQQARDEVDQEIKRRAAEGE